MDGDAIFLVRKDLTHCHSLIFTSDRGYGGIQPNLAAARRLFLTVEY